MDDLTFDDLPDVEDVPPSPSDPDFTCPDCGKVSKNARGLSMHRKRTHGVESAKDEAPKSVRRASNIEKDLQDFFMMIAMVVTMVNQNDGMILAANAERNAKAWANLARQNKMVRNFLDGMIKSSAIGEVVMATAFTAVPIMANHKMLPPEIAGLFGGIVVPEPQAFGSDE